MLLDQALVSLQVEETCGDRVAQKARIGTATAFLRPILRELNVESLALHVTGLNGSGEKGLPFPGGLGTCEGGLEPPRCPGFVVPGNA